MSTKLNKISLFILAVVFLPLYSIAQNTTTAAPVAKDNFWYNPLVWSLVGIMIILLFAIGVMGNILKNLALAYREKMRNDKQGSNIIKTVLLFVACSMLAGHTWAAEAVAPVAKVDAGIGGIATTDFYVLISIIIFEIATIIALLFIVRILLNALNDKPETVRAKKLARISFWDRFNSSVAVEKEADVMLDHDYDGIRELDNALPPWWKYGFYVTIIFAGIYLYRYQYSHLGMNPQEEYLAEVQEAKESQAAYLANAANKVDESNVTPLTDAASLDAGKNVFQSTCAACHLKDGGGSVGPNLTDDYWIHGGGIKDIFKSIKYGWQEKGMKSWKDDFSPKQIQQIASYVKSLHGTHPATPKEKQGELYIEGSTTPAKDSVKTENKPVAAN